MQTGQLARKPKSDRPFWPGAGRGEILEQIATTLNQAGAVVVLTGGAAMGKTRLALEAMAWIEAADIPCSVLAGTHHAELTAAVGELTRLPAPQPANARAQSLLVVDQAEACDAQTLERLILAAGEAFIAVMLVGRVELVGTLVRLVPEQVCDRITRYVALEPLDAPQTAAFVLHRLAAEASPVTCGDDALRRIVVHSHGVPGAIDRLMGDALRLARLSRTARLTATVIDMIADDHLPEERHAPEPEVETLSFHARYPAARYPVGDEPHSPSERLPPSSARTLRQHVPPAAGAERNLAFSQHSASQQSAGTARSMHSILADLQERPGIPPAQDEEPDDFAIPDWPTPPAMHSRSPAGATRRILPWAGGIALVVVATSVFALQPYLQADSPSPSLADHPRAVAGSLIGDSIMHPAAASAKPAPRPIESPAAEPSPVMDDTSTAQITMVAEPAAQASVTMPKPPEEPISEPVVKAPPDNRLSPQEPVTDARPKPEPPALAPALANEPAAEALSPLEPEPPSLESMPPDAAAEAPSAEIPSEPAPAEPAATIAAPEPVPQELSPEPSPERASPPEPEPTVAGPVPPPAPATPKPPAVAESVLLEKGDRLLALGDIASARLLYETAAAGGSARGALLAGRTLDPAYLRTLGARGMTGDPARAAAWYEKAAKLGDNSATALLEALGRR